ncbi:alcohol dehydrogenase [Lactiplantibacillus plantarum subsp. plantarum]|uniref:Alcohol dehydrogenase n=1 Tax=Lactiplantibacillus plantarum subsp. plantarum TaxID=337330 RepID=A0A2S3U9G6_LACPN|nr:alcohol dehydrogenase [Lactiplantibacillus plantarum subsp. plantarum]
MRTGHWLKYLANQVIYTDAQLNDLLTLSDVMATGYHAAATAEVKQGDTVGVMGDGAVGLCGVISAKLRGASRILP